MFFGRNKIKTRPQPSESRAPSLSRDDLCPAPVLTTGSSERLASLRNPFRRAIAEGLYPKIKEDLAELNRLEGAKTEKQQEGSSALGLRVKTAVLEFAARFEPQAEAAIRRLSELDDLNQQTERLAANVSALYADCASSGKIDLSETRFLLKDFERDWARLLGPQKSQSLSSLLDKTLQDNPLKALALLEEALIGNSSHIIAEKHATIEQCAGLIEGAIALCQQIAHDEIIQPKIAKLASFWREKYALYYIDSSPEVWAASSQRNAAPADFEENIRRNAAAFKLYKQAIELDTQAEKLSASSQFSAAKLLTEGERLMACGQLWQALINAKAALQASPPTDRAAAHILQGRLYERSGLPALAQHAYKSAIMIQPDRPEAYLRLLSLHSDAKGLAQVLNELRDLKQYHPKVLELDLHIILGQIKRRDDGAAAFGIQNLRADYGECAEVSYAKALLSLAQSDTHAAEENLTRAVQQGLAADARTADAFVKLGRLLQQRGYRLQAEQCFKNAIQADPAGEDSYQELSNIKGPAKLAIPEMRALADRNNTCAAWLALARLQLRDNQAAKAVESLKKAHALAPASLNPLLELAHIYTQEGKTEAAFETYLCAYRMCPVRKDLAAELLKLAQLEPDLAEQLSKVEVEEANTSSPVEACHISAATELPCPPLEDACLPARRADLPPMLVMRFSTDRSKRQALLKLDSALQAARNQHEIDTALAALEALVAKTLEEQFPDLTRLVSLNQPGSDIHRLHEHALGELKAAVKLVDNWFKTSCNLSTVSQTTWNNLSLQIYSYLDPYNQQAVLPRFIREFKKLGAAVSELESSSPMLNNLKELPEAFCSAMEQAASAWAKLCGRFTSLSQPTSVITGDAQALLKGLEKARFLLEREYWQAVKKFSAGFDTWLRDGAQLLSETCLNLEAEAAAESKGDSPEPKAKSPSSAQSETIHSPQPPPQAADSPLHLAGSAPKAQAAAGP